MILFQATASCPKYSWIDITISIGTLISAVTAITAIIYTAISIRQQRKHNELSIKPRATILTSDWNKKLIMSLKNTGLGPLIITHMEFKLNDQKTRNISDLIPEKLYSRIKIMEIVTGAICPNESVKIFELVFKKSKNGQKNKKKVIKLLKKVKIVCSYTDIYDNKTNGYMGIPF